MWNGELELESVFVVRISQPEIHFFCILLDITIVICEQARGSNRMAYLEVRVTVMFSGSGSETYLVITNTKLSHCFTFSLTGTRATWLDSQLLGIDMGRNEVNKWVWHQCFRFSITLCSTQCCK